MRRSLFKKYLSLSFMVILISFAVMGVILFISVSNYWVSDKYETMDENVRRLTTIASKRMIFKNNDGTFTISRDMQTLMDNYAMGSNADLFITSADGRCIMYASIDEPRDFGRTVPESILKQAMAGGYHGVSDLNGIYGVEQYAVGVPIYYLDTPQAVGALFITTSARSYGAFRNDIIRICLIAALFTAAISFLSAGIMSYRMVLPLREMSAAAVSFGKGDFSRRVRVRGDDEVGELANAFNNMASSLASGESMRRSFIANVSHELKTPMTTIAGFIDGILDGTIPADKQKQYLQIVSTEVKRLSRLVRSMLDLSRIDSGEMRLHCVRFDLKDTIFDTMLSFEATIETRRIHILGLDEMESVFVQGDPDLVHQVVYNLVENAVKFVDEGGSIRVSLKEAAERALVSIRNTGPGIPADEIPLVFDRFYKTDKSRSVDKNGMGLGLYLVRTIVQLHGGEIAVRSVENEFCEFEFWLPKQPLAASAASNKKKL